MTIARTLIVLVALTGLASCKTKAEWRNRTIYQLMTDRFWRTDNKTDDCLDLRSYCGGTYRGIIQNLDYIQGMGFDAVWISPIPKNTRNGYHGYYAKDFEQLNEHFGSEEDLVELISALHERGMWVLLDVVANHAGYIDNNNNFSMIHPFDKKEYYHNYCRIDDIDYKTDPKRVRRCWLSDLPDLDQQNQFVRNYLINWIKRIVEKYKIDGIRIDTVAQVPKHFWAEYAESAGVFSIGEVAVGRNISYVAEYQGALDGVLNYPLYYALTDVYANGKTMYDLRAWISDIRYEFLDVSVLGSFLDNHDQPRFLSYKASTTKRLRSALAFILFSEGIPIVYYGTEQGDGNGNDPFNRKPLWMALNPGSPMYSFITILVGYRKKLKVWNEKFIERYVSDDVFIFSRGKNLVVTTNSQKPQDLHIQVDYLPFDEGEIICNVLSLGGAGKKCVEVRNGAVNIAIMDKEAMFFVPRSDLN